MTNSLENLFRHIPIQNQVEDIWRSLVSLPRIDSFSSIRDISTSYFDSGLKGLKESSYLYRTFHCDLRICLGFILFENAFLRKNYPEYFLQILQKLFETSKFFQSIDIFMQFISLLTSFKGEERTPERISQRIIELFNKVNDFHEGVAIFLEAFISLHSKKPLPNQDLGELIAFINKYIDFSISSAFFENRTFVFIHNKGENFEISNKFIEIEGNHHILLYSLGYSKAFFIENRSSFKEPILKSLKSSQIPQMRPPEEVPESTIKKSLKFETYSQEKMPLVRDVNSSGGNLWQSIKMPSSEKGSLLRESNVNPERHSLKQSEIIRSIMKKTSSEDLKTENSSLKQSEINKTIKISQKIEDHIDKSGGKKQSMKKSDLRVSKNLDFSKSCENLACKKILQNPRMFHNLKCGHSFCFNCVQSAFLENVSPLCWKNLCFQQLDSRKLKAFLEESEEVVENNDSEEEEKKEKEEEEEFEQEKIEESTYKFINKNYSDVCNNTECKNEVPKGFLMNEDGCGHIFCEKCAAICLKRGSLCLTNYCFSKWDEQKLKEFLDLKSGFSLTKSACPLKKSNIIMKNNLWVSEVLN